MMGKDIVYREKTVNDSWSDIVDLLKLAHQANHKIGVVMKTVNTTVDMLLHKLENGLTFLAISPENEFVGTLSVIFQSGRGKWYEVNESIAFLAYGAVNPDYQGLGIASNLYVYIEKEVQKRNVSMFKSGTAEKNIPQRRTFDKNGYIPVELLSNLNVDYYSIIYVKYNHELPHSRMYYRIRFWLSCIKFKSMYRPGKVPRLPLKVYCKLKSLAQKNS